MSENRCRYCLLDCRTPLALEKHEAKCSKNERIKIMSRHKKAREDRCPVCLDAFVELGVIDAETWVCLNCGCHFTPRSRLFDINEKRREEAEKAREKA